MAEPRERSWKPVHLAGGAGSVGNSSPAIITRSVVPTLLIGMGVLLATSPLLASVGVR